MIGAGSVATESVPAYHVVVINPARPVRKVAPDVPDAPGSVYEVRGDHVLVGGNRSSEDQLSEEGLQTPARKMETLVFSRWDMPVYARTKRLCLLADLQSRYSHSSLPRCWVTG